MKKTYIMPTLRSAELQAENMLALSVDVDGDKKADASGSYTHKKHGWSSSNWASPGADGEE